MAKQPRAGKPAGTSGAGKPAGTSGAGKPAGTTSAAPAPLAVGTRFTALETFEATINGCVNRYRAGGSYTVREGNLELAALAAGWLAVGRIELGTPIPRTALPVTARGAMRTKGKRPAKKGGKR